MAYEKNLIRLAEDLKDVSVKELNSIDFFLLHSQSFHLGNNLYNCLLEENFRRNPTYSYAQCVAWLAFAAHSTIQEMVPRGNYTGKPRAHLSRLTDVVLPRRTGYDEESENLIQIEKLLNILQHCDFSSWTDEHRVMFIYALLKASLRFPRPCEVPEIGAFLRLLFSYESSRVLSGSLASIFTSLTDDPKQLRDIMEMLYLATFNVEIPVMMTAEYFICVSERGEVAEMKPSFEEPKRMYVRKMCEIIDLLVVDVMERTDQAFIRDLVRYVIDEEIEGMYGKSARLLFLNPQLLNALRSLFGLRTQRRSHRNRDSYRRSEQAISERLAFQARAFPPAP
ncbi:unnamed protein product [Caenorhabditis auriculariae]|uniref:Uncharacterized protein n=1 Tax=Caenorhabditis auriculariae TaxID=2777116 RepID=A0A8S1GYZ8_9PELO|nr:unnamed protein product [Caenorhabditis auriculariae]